MKWAPHATRSHLQEYINRIPASGTSGYASYAMAADSILEFVDLALPTTTTVLVRCLDCLHQNVIFKVNYNLK